MKKYFRKLASISLVILFFLMGSIESFSLPDSRKEDVLSKQSEKIRELQDQLESVRLQIDFLGLKVRDSRTSVGKFEDKIAEKRKQIKILYDQLQELASETVLAQSEVDRISHDISVGQASFGVILSRFRARLVHLHKIRQGTLLTSVFSSKDLNTFLSRYQMVRYLLLSDEKIMSELIKIREKLISDKANEIEKKNRFENLFKLAEKNRAELIIQNGILTGLLQTLILERKVFLARQKRLEKDQSYLETQLSRIEETRKGDPEGFETQLENNGLSQTSKTNLPSKAKSTSAETPSSKIKPSMGFRWPLPKIYDLGFLQNGVRSPTSVKLSIPCDSEIISSLRGKVLFKGEMGEFGNVIIINHKNGFSTIYGSLDEIDVGLGQVVESGETIGKIIGGNNSKLHFEIRFGGKAQELLTFLPPVN